MAEAVSGQGQRWTAKRRAALVRRVLKGAISVREAARKYGLTVAELKEWRHRFLLAAENALRFPPIDEEAFEDERITEPEQRIRELAALRERVSPATGASAADSTGSGSRDGEGRYRHVLESVRVLPHPAILFVESTTGT